MDSRAFYDDYVDRQAAVGVNERHRAILAWLRRFGLQGHHRVLEIGCGIGTVTGLISEEVRAAGSVLAVDLSPRSIAAASERLAACTNVRLEAADVLEMVLDETFDVVVLPDVIEHIPSDRHGALFERIASWTRPDGFVLLHYPNPWYSLWCAKHRPDLLQLVDQPVHAHEVATHAWAHGLHLDFLQTYSIWIDEGDYVAAVLRPVRSGGSFTPRPSPGPTLLERIRGRVRRLLG
jgi:trans-aconitate 2-methyltransferase